MSTAVFGHAYASEYDALYQDKDYEAECDLVEAALRRFGHGSLQTILDLGCGTGNHALPLARRGYRVTGVDRSPHMLAQARHKAATLGEGHAPTFIEGDLCALDLGQRYDVVLMMFAVLGYQYTNAAALAALGAVRRHLRPGGLFIADFWYGPAVLATRPSERVKVIPTAQGRLIRAAAGTLDVARQLCTVRYHLWHLEGERLTNETEEAHGVRFFFPLELELLLGQSGLRQQRLSAFMHLDRPADESTWNVLLVADSDQPTAVSP
jgi:SAM-dependent methyltransferase